MSLPNRQAYFTRAFVVFDAQMMNPRLERFGAYVVGDREYQKLLEQAIR